MSHEYIGIQISQIITDLEEVLAAEDGLEGTCLEQNIQISIKDLKALAFEVWKYSKGDKL